MTPVAAETDALLTDLSVMVEKELEKRLRAFVRLERCRSLREIGIYFLEVMLAVASRCPDLRLRSKRTAKLSGHIRMLVSIELFEAVVSKASEYGMKHSEFVRVCLQMVLDWHEQLVSDREILRKEDFIELILSQFETSART